MEEPIKTPAAENAEAENDKQKESGVTKLPVGTVTLSVTQGGETKDEIVRFHTPSILETVRKLTDDATIRIIGDPEPGKTEKRTLLEGTKEEAIAALTAATVPPALIVAHLQNLARALLDHSLLKGIGIHVVFNDEEGNDHGSGFVFTAPDCQPAQAVELVNCGDANIDAFISKANLSVPGHTSRQQGEIVAPTAEQVQKLG